MSDYIKFSFKNYIVCFLKSYGWDKESPSKLIPKEVITSDTGTCNDMKWERWYGCVDIKEIIEMSDGFIEISSWCKEWVSGWDSLRI